MLEPLALLPCVVLQSAIKFINLTVPSSAGRIAMNLRFLQRMGVPTPEALAAGAVDDASETDRAGGSLLPGDSLRQGEDRHQPAPLRGTRRRLIAAIVIALVVSVAVMLAVPKLRAKVVPPFKQGFTSLWRVIRNRRKRLELFGGNVGSEVLYAIALGATCHAYGVDLYAGAAHPRQHGRLGPVELHPGARRDRSRRGEPHGGPRGDGSRRVHGLRDRLHPAALHVLPAPDLGLLSLRWLSRKAYI